MYFIFGEKKCLQGDFNNILMRSSPNLFKKSRCESELGTLLVLANGHIKTQYRVRSTTMMFFNHTSIWLEKVK